MIRRFWNTILNYLRAGMSAEKLALTCAIGVIVGTLPIWGITTGLCFILAFAFRLNVVILQLINYILYPAQLLLILPFIKAGTLVFNVNPLPYSLNQLIELFKSDFWKTIQELGVALSLGAAVWAMVSVIVFIAVYSTCLMVFRKWSVVHQRELKSE